MNGASLTYFLSRMSFFLVRACAHIQGESKIIGGPEQSLLAATKTWLL